MCTNGEMVPMVVVAPMGDLNYDVSMCTNGEITNGGECTNG